MLAVSLTALAVVLGTAPEAVPPVRTTKITILSTMLADRGIGEWGFSALVEVDGKRLLFDTGAQPGRPPKRAGPGFPLRLDGPRARAGPSPIGEMTAIRRAPIGLSLPEVSAGRSPAWARRLRKRLVS